MPNDLPGSLAALDPPAGADPNSVPSPTVTHYQQVADQVGETLKQAFALIASFEAPHTSTLGFVRSHKAIPAQFIATAIAAVESTPELQSVNKFDVTEARDVLQFIDAFRTVVDQMDVLAQQLKFTIDGRKAKVAADALQIYDIAKGVARDPGSGVLQLHVKNMRRDLGRTRPTPREKPPVTPGSGSPN